MIAILVTSLIPRSAECECDLYYSHLHLPLLECPSDSVMTSSKMTWQELNNGGITSTSGSITDTSCTIEGLKSTTIYSIAVTVDNIFVNNDSHPIIILWLYVILHE